MSKIIRKSIVIMVITVTTILSLALLSNTFALNLSGQVKSMESNEISDEFINTSLKKDVYSAAVKSCSRRL